MYRVLYRPLDNRAVGNSISTHGSTATFKNKEGERK